MTDLLITNAKIITPERTISKGWLLARDGKITAIGTQIAPDIPDVRVFGANGLTLLSGFIDIHVHGAVGADTMDANPESLRKMARFYAQQGVTGFTPTTLTASHEETLAALETIKSIMKEAVDGAAILGCHLEGPYLNLEKSGAQNKQYIRRAEKREATAYLDIGVIRLISLAPEFEENHWLIQACVERGITVSVAHTNASYSQMKAAIALGITHATHTYNAMTGLHHREPGVLGAVMESFAVRCELVADNVHVHPTAMNILWQAKGKDRLILITDSMMAAGMADGHYKLGDYAVTVAEGKVILANGTLAGSILTMNQAVLNFMRATGEPLDNIWQVMSLNAARAINIAHRKGSLEIGKDADLVLVDEELHVQLTVVDGNIVYDAKNDRGFD
ncbi:MAG: N-acetylglucosamine-6-phosphate deacetylase [Anaerolineae bacterium]|nr:N-acetylglucosamine-6-phosphate deacetylase [Anaerolineae bacterium]MDQ7034867.1 N-acetylglucosamine-6-phosphate deacetylase [Anaerolineae bacterium]